jgi:hypothetical protein
MKLSRNVPAHKRTEKFTWCKKDFLVIDQRYRDIRAKMRKPMDSCYWCGHKFIDGEMMALACPIRGTNKVLCQPCAEELHSFARKARTGEGA